MEALILQLLSGAIAGTAVGALFKKITLGTIGDALAGMLGGAGCAYLLGALGLISVSTNLTIGIIISSLTIGAIGGGVALVLINQLKSLISSR